MKPLRAVLLAASALQLGWVAGCATAPAKRPALTDQCVRFPEAPDPARLVFLTTLEDAVGETRPASSLERFLYGDTTSRGSSVVTPYGIATWEGQVLVCDTQENCVHCFDLDTGTHSRLGESGTGQTSEPVDVAVGADGSRYVADSRGGQIVVFDSSNRFVRAIQGSGESFKPVSVAVGGDTLYAADLASKRIERFHLPDGVSSGTVGSQGSGDGQFVMPTGVEVDAEGRLYVSDALLARVQVFDRDGARLSAFGRPGQTAGCMARPRRLTVASDSVIYVADAVFHRVHLFNTDGEILMFLGGPGDTPGSTNAAADVCVNTSLLNRFERWIPEDFDAQYLVLVANQLGPSKVGVYAFGRVASQSESE